MTALASISFLVGAALGVRFKMLILVPAIGCSVALVAANGIVIGENPWRLALMVVVAATAIQLGYFGGAVAQLLFRSAGGTLRSKVRAQQSVSDGASRIVTPTL